jgi:hypothetical protein
MNLNSQLILSLLIYGSFPEIILLDEAKPQSVSEVLGSQTFPSQCQRDFSTLIVLGIGEREVGVHLIFYYVAEPI